MLRHIVVATSLACLVGAVAPHQADAKEISKIKKFKGTRDQVRATCTGKGRELIEAGDQTWCGDDKRRTAVICGDNGDCWGTAPKDRKAGTPKVQAAKPYKKVQ